MSRQRLPIPAYLQTSDPLPDGQPDPQAANDCGEECSAMLGAAYGFFVVPGTLYPGATAGALRVLKDQGQIPGSGLSTAADILNMLQWAYKLPAHARNVDPVTAQLEIQRALAARMPCAWLGRWVDPSINHWEVISAADSSGVSVNDPIRGEIDWTWSQALPLFLNWYVHLDLVLP